MHRIIATAILVAGSPLAFCQADIVTFANHSFEGGATGNQLNDMTFTGSFGDQDTSFFGLSNANPRTGATSHTMDLGNDGTDNSGFGGNFSTFNIRGWAGQLANGDSFTVESYFATDIADPFTGGGEVNVHLEFYDAARSLIFRTDSVGLQSRFTSATISTSYQLRSHTYTFGNAAQVADVSLVDEVRAVITASNGNNSGDGLVYVDDYRFFGDIASVPEPSSCSLLLLGIFAIGRRRSKRA